MTSKLHHLTSSFLLHHSPHVSNHQGSGSLAQPAHSPHPLSTGPKNFSATATSTTADTDADTDADTEGNYTCINRQMAQWKRYEEGVLDSEDSEVVVPETLDKGRSEQGDSALELSFKFPWSGPKQFEDCDELKVNNTWELVQVMAKKVLEGI